MAERLQRMDEARKHDFEKMDKRMQQMEEDG